MSNWKEYLLEDVIDKFIDYRGKTPKKTKSGIPLITAKIVKNGRILEPNEFIALEDYDSWMTRGLPEVDDIVLTTEAPLGEIALIKNKNVALAQRIITLRGKKQFVFNPFLKYYFQSRNGQYELQSRASGTTVFGIKAEVLRKVHIFLPHIAEQRAIASILSSLDDKIDLLQRQNKTLEAMTGALFRQWFVEEAEDEWKIKISELPIEIIDGDRGKNYPKNCDLLDVGYCLFLSTKNVTMNGFNFNQCQFITVEKEGLLRSGKLNRNDIVITTRGTVGNIAYYNDLICYTDIRINSGMIIIRTVPSLIDPIFIFCLIQSNYFKCLIENQTSGSAQPQLPIRDFKQIEVYYPPKEKIDNFLAFAKPCLNKKFYNDLQIEKVEKLRNILLSKLMSGEVRVEYETN